MEWNEKAVTPLSAEHIKAKATLHYTKKLKLYTIQLVLILLHLTNPLPRGYALEDGLDRILSPALVPNEMSDLALDR